VSDCNFPGYKYSGWFDEDCELKRFDRLVPDLIVLNQIWVT